MTHLESLIAEYLEWKGYLVKKNIKVGRLNHGGWEMELDVIGFHPQTQHLVHYEPSLDAFGWKKREERYIKKFAAGRKYILKSIFPWLPSRTSIEHIAVFHSHPKGRDRIAGGRILSVDELTNQIRTEIAECGPMVHNAIPEYYPLLRTIQLVDNGYHRALPRDT